MSPFILITKNMPFHQNDKCVAPGVIIHFERLITLNLIDSTDMGHKRPGQDSDSI